MGENAKRRLSVLMVEDNENDALLMADVLARGGYKPKWKRVDCARGLREALAEGGWQLVLSDYRLPGFSALDALAICREAGFDGPFLLVSGSLGDEIEAVVSATGVHGCLLKDELARLAAVVRQALAHAAAGYSGRAKR
jgi:two-component system, sensor histidine kinase and response regulator